MDKMLLMAWTLILIIEITEMVEVNYNILRTIGFLLTIVIWLAHLGVVIGGV